MSKYWSEVLKNLTPYKAGEQPQNQIYIKLNTNENPYPPSPEAIEKIKYLASGELRLYPDPEANELKKAIADYYNADRNNVFVGNSSDEVLALSFISFFKQKEPILFPDLTYSFYPVYCSLYEIKYQCIPLTEKFDIKIEDYDRTNGGIIFPNPNAPTGKYLELNKIETLLQQNKDSVVIIDEAYIDFGGETCISLIDRYPNLLVTQTFSKSRALAGLRVGFAVGNKELIEGLNRVKNSFNSYPLDRLAIGGGVAAILDREYFDRCCNLIIKTREWTKEALTSLGFYVLPSKANFLFIKHPKYSGKFIYEQLKNKGILVRYFDKDRIREFVRVSIGTIEDMKKFIEAIEVIINLLE
ncbi:MAG: histidinol-phosphate transaminase [Prochloraceae cyanobacterium]